VEVGLIGDSRQTLSLLLPRLHRKEDRRFLETAQAGMTDWRELMRRRGTRQDTPMKPQVVAWELGQRLADHAIVSADSGTVASWWAQEIPARPGQMYSLSGTLASMANGLPHTIAAQLAYPDRQCVGFVGDGGFSMLMAEFATCVKYRLPVKIIVLRNDTLGMIKWEQMAFLGNPEYGCDLQPIDFAAVARACGGTGMTISHPADCGRILDEALATSGPVLVEAIVDPFEPPYPPRIDGDQAVQFAKALLRGEPNRDKIALTLLSDKVRQLI